MPCGLLAPAWQRAVQLEHGDLADGLELGRRDLDHEPVVEPDAVADQDRLGVGDGLGHDHGHGKHVAHDDADIEPLVLKLQDRVGLGLGDGLNHGQLDRDAHSLGDGDCDGSVRLSG
jgi:hypothetical protein